MTTYLDNVNRLLSRVDLDLVMTDELLASAKETCLLPVLVQGDTFMAQITFDVSLILTMLVALFFVPFLSYLVLIQT